MIEQETLRPAPAQRLRFLPALFALTVVTLALVGWMFHADIRRQIAGLATAQTDSTQWSLKQAEIEAMAVQRAIWQLREAPTAPERAAELRRRFDILYSRVQTLRDGRSFQPMEGSAAAMDLDRLQQMLDGSVPAIDASDAELSAAIPLLDERFEAALPLVRQVALAGLSHSTVLSDRRRQEITDALSRLSLLVVPLFALLAGSTLVLFFMFRAAQVQNLRIAAFGERMRSLFDASTDAILFARPDGRVRGYNRAAMRIYGYEPHEVMGGDVVELLTPPEHREAVRGLLAEAQKGRARPLGDAPEVIKATARHKSGQVIPVEMSWSIASDVGGPLLVAFVRDVSGRAREEAELIEARDKAVAGEQAKDRMVAVMSHEMRTPLNGILGTLDLLKRTAPDDGRRHYLDVMEHSARMLLQHVNDVLDASRAIQEPSALATAPIQLGDLVRNTVAGLAAHAEARGNRLVLSIIGEGPPLMGNAARIEQILVNLIGNAIKFTESGEIHVELDQSARPGEIEFRISDTGIGIAEEDLPRIFDDFVTLDPTFDRKAQGTGLGLSIVKNLVEQMRGHIEVVSELGGGSVFSVSLTLEPATGEMPVAPVSAIRPPRDQSPRNLRVLMIEDNDINRMIARDMLHLEGCEVTEATDGAAGCRIARDAAFDLILMDISMPGMNGVDAARAIRAQGANRDTPIAALTAHAMPADLSRFREAGMCHTLVKPLQLSQLSDLLTEMFPRSRRDRPRATGAHAAAPDEQLLDRVAAELADGLPRLCRLSGESAAALAHRLAGSAAVVGLAEIHRGLAELEGALRSDRPVCVDTAAQNILTQLKDFVKSRPRAAVGQAGQ